MLYSYILIQGKKEGERERQLVSQECHTSCLIVGSGRNGNNNRTNRWGKIYIQNCTRQFFFLISVQKVYEEAKWLNVCSMIVESSLDNLFWAIFHVYER